MEKQMEAMEVHVCLLSGSSCSIALLPETLVAHLTLRSESGVGSRPELTVLGFFLPRGSDSIDLEPSNNLVLRPPTTSGVSNRKVGSSIESPRSLWGKEFLQRSPGFGRPGYKSRGVLPTSKRDYFLIYCVWTNPFRNH